MRGTGSNMGGQAPCSEWTVGCLTNENFVSSFYLKFSTWGRKFCKLWNISFQKLHQEPFCLGKKL